MAHGEVVSICENPVCARRFDELERRVTDLESDEYKQRIWDAVNDIREKVANLNGRVAGYLVAGGVLGSIVGALVSIVASLALKG